MKLYMPICISSPSIVSVPVIFPSFSLAKAQNNFIWRHFARILDKLQNEHAALDHIVQNEIRFVNNSVVAILADDDADDRELFKEAVTRVNSKIKIKAVEDGIELMKILNNNEIHLPDVIFLDLNMPGKNGKECLREIRNNNKFNDIPVIIYSTSNSSSDISDTHLMGANLYVRKPNSFKVLIATIQKIISLDWNNYAPGSSKTNFIFSGVK